MNKRLKRFVETTVPMVIGYGLVIVVATGYVGIHWGILGIVIFASIDVIMVR